MRNVLEKAEVADFEFLVGVLDNKLSFADGFEMQRALLLYRKNATRRRKRALVALLDREIRYAGSTDLGYFFRWVAGGDPGVTPDQLITDVAKKLDVKIRMLGSVESKLERLTKAVVEKEVQRMTVAEQRDLLLRSGSGLNAAREVRRRLRRHGPVAVLPVLLSVVGAQTCERVITGLVIRQIGRVIGRDAARHLVGRLALRFPWWAEWIGPAAWALTGTLIALDLQGPAYRKTIPATLYLGLVGLRGAPKVDSD